MSNQQQRQIPLLDLKAQNSPIRGEIYAAIDRVFDSQQFILGEDMRLLEEEIADYCGVKHAVGCASGTDALYLALFAAGVKHGDAVLTTPFTFFATAGAVTRVGATPVFVDIDPATFNMAPRPAHRRAQVPSPRQSRHSDPPVRRQRGHGAHQRSR